MFRRDLNCYIPLRHQKPDIWGPKIEFFVIISTVTTHRDNPVNAT